MADAIKKELVNKGIKLWKPPYYGVCHHQEALQELATTTRSFAANESPAKALEHLQDLRQHALDKLRNKHKLLQTLVLKILGNNDDRRHILTKTADDENVDFPEHWAATVKREGNLLCLEQPNPDLTVAQFVQDLQSKVPVRDNDTTRTAAAVVGIRLIHKGKTLTGTTRLQELSGSPNGKASVLCLVQSHAAVAVTVAASTAAAQDTRTMQSDEELIASIRQAANRLQSKSMLDITDAAGNLVSMSHNDRLAFLTALGLHALGQERLQENQLESALVFLLQADVEWERLDASWRTRVDNYGLLQLDVAWLYLKFESMDSLPDVMDRLAKAEASLRKQVHNNFVTLALVQADLENPVPALCAIFVRLFLLQGVAQHYQGSTIASKERLDWAWGLAKSLRAVSPPDAVARLVEAVDVTPQQAIAALRRTNGDGNRAATLIQQQTVDAEKATEDRYKQRQYGLCDNGTDHVHLQRLAEIKPLLGLPPGQDECVGSGLLRLVNNDLGQALDRYQTCGRSVITVLDQVAALDASQGVSRRKRRHVVEVDEMALASLESMGVDDATARRALERTANDVEAALLWITTAHQNNSPSSSFSDSTNHTNGSGGNTLPPAMGATEDDPSGSAAASSSNTNDDFLTHQNETVATDTAHPVDGDMLRKQQAEREAVELLERVLGNVLEQQEHQGDENVLGNSLDEEWAYLEKFRG